MTARLPGVRDFGSPDLVLYHGDCDDGFGAAWAAWNMWPDIEYREVKRGAQLPNVEGRRVLMLDFAYDRATTELLASRAETFTVIDHHTTSQRELVGLDYCFFDPERSGAGLAWDLIHVKARPPMINYIEDHDLGRDQLPWIKEWVAAFRTFARTFEDWSKLDELWRRCNELFREGPPETIVEMGEAILKAQAVQINWIRETSQRMNIVGHVVPVANSCIFRTEAAAELAKGWPFAVVWYRMNTGKIRLSFSSTGKGVSVKDVSKIAERYGGGGRARAAGAIINSFDELYVDSSVCKRPHVDETLR